jgi:hypothetical protein
MESGMQEAARYLKALVFLQLRQYAGGGEFTKPEVLLSKAGFSIHEISEMLNKKYAAVAKTLSRSRQNDSLEDTVDE